MGRDRSDVPIFVSYRRADSHRDVERLVSDLGLLIGASRIYSDARLPPGDPYQSTLGQRVEHAKIVLVVIGDRWLELLHERMKHPEEDLHRQEIAAALADPKKIVIPVLIGDAPMPRNEELPPDLQPLLRRHAFKLERWSEDIRQLADEIWPRRRWRRTTVAAVAVIALGIVAAVLAIAFRKDHRLDPIPGMLPPRFSSSPPPESEVRSWAVFKAFAAQQPEIFRDYGIPSIVKFVNVHDQPFQRGRAIYDTTNAACSWLFGRDTGAFEDTDTAEALAGAQGNVIDEELFADITQGLNDAERARYRRLVESRTRSPDLTGIGILGGIATQYVRNRFIDRLGAPRDNERLARDACYVANSNYRIIAGLRHDIGPNNPKSPQSVYVLYVRERKFRRHTVFPRHDQ